MQVLLITHTHTRYPKTNYKTNRDCDSSTKEDQAKNQKDNSPLSGIVPTNRRSAHRIEGRNVKQDLLQERNVRPEDCSFSSMVQQAICTQ